MGHERGEVAGGAGETGGPGAGPGRARLPSIAEQEQERADAAPAYRPLEAALRGELSRLETTTLSVWQIFGVIGVVYGGVVGLTVSRGLGITSAVAAAAFVLAFTVVGRRMRRAPERAGPRIAIACLEGAIPWVFAAIVVETQGATYALGSWVPPMLFCALVLAAGARLRPALPLVLGLSGAVIYQVFYWGW
ncbi:MAG: hypothetical protein R3B70_18520 [Polyangiaceae bacterium]